MVDYSHRMRPKNPRRLCGFLALGAVLASLSCGKIGRICEPTGVSQAADIMEREGEKPEAERRALKRLAKACPDANPAIFHGLALDYVSDYRGSLEVPEGDEERRRGRRRPAASPRR